MIIAIQELVPLRTYGLGGLTVESFSLGKMHESVYVTFPGGKDRDIRLFFLVLSGAGDLDQLTHIAGCGKSVFMMTFLK